MAGKGVSKVVEPLEPPFPCLELNIWVRDGGPEYSLGESFYGGNQALDGVDVGAVEHAALAQHALRCIG